MLRKLTHEYIRDLKAYRKSPSNSTKLFMGVFVHPVVYTTFFVIRETPVLKRGLEAALDRLVPDDSSSETNQTNGLTSSD